MEEDEGIRSYISAIFSYPHLKNEGGLTSILSVIFPFVFVWLSLVLPLTFSKFSVTALRLSIFGESYVDVKVEPVGSIGRSLVWDVAMYYLLPYDEFKKISRAAGFEEIPREVWERNRETFKMSGFIAVRALMHSKWLCKKIPLLTQCSPYQPLPAKAVGKIPPGISEGIIDGLWLGTSPYLLIGLSLLACIIGLETLSQGIIKGLWGIVFPATILFLPFYLFELLIVALVIVVQAITRGWVEYSVAFLISSVVGLIGPWGLFQVLSVAISELPKVFREPLAGAVLGVVVGGIIADLIQPPPKIPFWTIGATTGVFLGILTVSFEKFFIALASLFTKIIQSIIEALGQTLINAIKGLIEGIALRIVLSIWQGGKIGIQDILQNLRQDIPSLIVWGVFGLIIGVIRGFVEGVKTERDRERGKRH